MKKLKITQQDYIKANRKASREEEIAMHGKPIRWQSAQASKKTYNRKRDKAGIKSLPFYIPTFKYESRRPRYIFLYVSFKSSGRYELATNLSNIA